MQQIILRRDKGWADSWRSYVLHLDGQKAGKIKQGEKLILTVEPGEHTLRAKIDWCSTKTLHFNIFQTDAQFLVRSDLRGWKIFLCFVYLFIPSKWISLEQIT